MAVKKETCVKCRRQRSMKFLKEGSCVHGTYYICAASESCNQAKRKADKEKKLLTKRIPSPLQWS